MDTQQLTHHLKQTPTYIQRHRSNIIPGGTGYDDNPTPSSFGPKSPCNEHAMELADMEAAFIGNLAHYCMTLGTIPHHSLKGLWWVNGECKGISTTGAPAIQGLINHLTHWAPYIIGTEGVEDLLKAGEETRWYSKKMFPNEEEEEQEDWVSEDEAIEITGRSKWALWEWRKSAVVRHIKTGNQIEYHKGDLKLIMEIKTGNMMRGTRLKQATLPIGTIQ